MHLPLALLPGLLSHKLSVPRALCVWLAAYVLCASALDALGSLHVPRILALDVLGRYMCCVRCAGALGLLHVLRALPCTLGLLPTLRVDTQTHCLGHVVR